MSEVSPSPAAAAHPPAPLMEIWRRFQEVPLTPDPPAVTEPEPEPRRQVGPGQMLGQQWELVRPLGRGGMGEVFEAFYLPAHHTYALKVLGGDHHDDPSARARFHNEFWALTVVKHAAIVAPFCAGEDDGIRWYAMEFLKGESLDRVIDRALLSPLRAAQIGVAIAGGLEAMHTAGIVHRDLKPANIFVLDDGQVKLIDLGIAKLLPEFFANAKRPPPVKDRLETLPGAPIGTPSFMAPEALLGEKASPAQDIYGLAATLFRAMVGTKPYGSHLPEEGDEPQWSEKRPIPRALGDVLRTALAVDPSRRYRTMEEFREDLDLVTAELEAEAAEEQVAAPSREPPAAIGAAAPTVIEGAASTSIEAEGVASESATGQGAIAIEPAARPGDANDLPSPITSEAGHLPVPRTGDPEPGDPGDGPPGDGGRAAGPIEAPSECQPAPELRPSDRRRRASIIGVALLCVALGFALGRVPSEAEGGITRWARAVAAAVRHLPPPREVEAAAQPALPPVPEDAVAEVAVPPADESSPMAPADTPPRRLGRAAFRRVVEAHASTLDRCIRMLPEGTEAEAEVRVHPDGSVEAVRLVPEVSFIAQRCADKALGGLHFPQADAPSTHTWPLRRL